MIPIRSEWDPRPKDAIFILGGSGKTIEVPPFITEEEFEELPSDPPQSLLQKIMGKNAGINRSKGGAATGQRTQGAATGQGGRRTAPVESATASGWDEDELVDEDATLDMFF
jgi:hypothetical protein